MHVYVSFRCIFLIFSCHLSKHPSICELFHIQVLMMVTETETLTSTLHHDIFTYLDYIFSCNLHTVGFYPYLLSYIYIYIYICVCVCVCVCVCISFSNQKERIHLSIHISLVLILIPRHLFAKQPKDANVGVLVQI